MMCTQGSLKLVFWTGLRAYGILKRMNIGDTSQTVEPREIFTESLLG